MQTYLYSLISTKPNINPFLYINNQFRQFEMFNLHGYYALVEMTIA